MYRGFKLKPFSIDDKADKMKLYEIGQQIFTECKAKCETQLCEFMMANNSLDGNAIMHSWFPQIEADVFISHSHKDEEMAKILAGWLFDSFKIKSFIDSCVWGYSEKLLKMIDNAYCLNEDKQTYDYDKRNRTTSHIHMMLSTALSMMIDNTECLFFLNSPQSITPTESFVKTDSPWLYFEIGMTQIIKKKTPKRVLNENIRNFSNKEYFEKAIQIEYQTDLSHLNELEPRELKIWAGQKGGNNGAAALDILYALSPAKEHFDSIQGHKFN